MATKSFLNKEQFKYAQTVLKAPPFPPDGNEKGRLVYYNEIFSAWLGLHLEERLRSNEMWWKADPIALGSWARTELCPISDFDLLFCGDEVAIEPLVGELQAQGLKVRARVPANPENWLEGVEPVDWLALHHARPFTPRAAEKLLKQQGMIQAAGPKVSQRILKTLLEERSSRRHRYDSITNFLEPNLKFGTGGLRDLQQGFYVRELWPEKFIRHHQAFLVLSYYKKFFLTVRQKLHFVSGGDVLIASCQDEIGRWMGFANLGDFMREIQKGLARVSFYTDWIFEIARTSEKSVRKKEWVRLRTARDCFFALHNDNSLVMQQRVRESIDGIFDDTKESQREIGAQLLKYLNIDAKDNFIRSLFRSRLIDKCIPEFGRIIGSVQHDQYHRYTVNAHIQQCLRVALRIHKKPKAHLGPLTKICKKLDEKDWQILLFSCVYHDIGKGLKGDHSIVGAKIARRDLTRLGIPIKLKVEIEWMVREHLALSRAAFRRNPLSKQTWADLHAKGVKGKRLERLAIFTVIDIIATNPDAWNEWKQSLLSNLVETLESKQSEKFAKVLSLAKEKKRKLDMELVESLNPVVLERVPAIALLNDCVELMKVADQKTSHYAKNLPVKVVTSGDMKCIRFHSFKDEPGLFGSYVTRLSAIGLSTRMASIQTIDKYGVYDWFFVPTTKTIKQIEKLLSLEIKESPVFDAKFEEIKTVTEDQNEWVICFKGRDQLGALATAALAIYEEGLEVNWAVVHTWGRMIDDVFGIKIKKTTGQSRKQIMTKLQKKWLRAKPKV